MGYDLIKPPKEPLNPVQFGMKCGNGLVTFSDDEDFIDSDSDLSLISDSDDSDCEDYAPLVDCDYKCGGTPIDPNCLEDGELNLAEEGGGYAHCHCHAAAMEAGKYSHLSEQAATFMEGLDKASTTIQCWYRCLMARFQVKGRAKLREMAANGVTALEIKQMPYGTSLVDVPGGMVINLNEEDIIFGDEIITSDEEEEEGSLLDADPWVEKYATEDLKEAIRVDKEVDELELIPESDDDDELSELSEIEDLSDIEINDE
jgi:hypothetical protein